MFATVFFAVQGKIENVRILRETDLYLEVYEENARLPRRRLLIPWSSISFVEIIEEVD